MILSAWPALWSALTSGWQSYRFTLSAGTEHEEMCATEYLVILQRSYKTTILNSGKFHETFNKFLQFPLSKSRRTAEVVEKGILRRLTVVTSIGGFVVWVVVAFTRLSLEV